ncbi:GNAT family N-acetyltransferase [Paenibacillus sp. NPDC058174]|uniref:GNAT family N-acetyltransferase n=1 Tax=Paenibacillus sp. NPDC058174 TaxID=3346366 RepID=UPI0036D8A1EA
MKVTFKRVETEAEINTVAQLASEIWNDYYISLISREQIEYMVEKYQSVHAINDQIEEEGYEYYLLQLNGQNVGYLGVKPEADKLFLSKFYILKAYRGKGYASVAMAYLLQICNAHKLSSIWLTVNRFNDAAIAVYEKKGFKKVQTQVADIGNGYVMDDYIMEKEIALAY